MLEALLAVLSSSGVGSIVGWAGGLMNRKMDHKNKLSEYDYQLKLRDKDMAQIELEIKRDAVITNGQVEVAAYNAMSASYAEQAIQTGTWVDGFSKMIRPITTLILLFVSIVISVYILYSAYNSGVTFAPADWKDWTEKCLEWVFFQTGVAIGWWFANRPGGYQR